MSFKFVYMDECMVFSQSELKGIEGMVDGSFLIVCVHRLSF